MSNAIVQVGPIETIPPDIHIVRAKLGGTMTNEDTKLVSAWAEGLRAEVARLHAETGKIVSILIDLREMGTYTDPETINILVKLMKDDDAHVHKTATFGGNVLHEMTERIISSMAGRTNLKNFKTEEEALSWLQI